MKSKLLTLFLFIAGFYTNVYAQPMAVFSWQQDPNNCGMVQFVDQSTCNGCTIVDWSWDFGDGASDTIQNPFHFYPVAQPYMVTLTVTDNFGNTADTTETINQIGNCLDVTLNTNFDPNDCFIIDCGEIVVEVTNGTPPFTYNWDNGVNTQNFPVCAPGGYTVTVTDATGQFGTASINIGSALFLDISVNPAICGYSTGSIDIAPNGSGPWTEFIWSNGETTPSISGLSSGNYSLTINDSANCTETFNFTITDSCGNLSGRVFSDENQNGSYDNGELPFTYGLVEAVGDSNTYSTNVTSGGGFIIATDTGEYVTNFTPYNAYYSISPINHLSHIPSLTSADTFDFAVTPIPGNPDLQVFINPLTPARPGFNATYQLIAKNVGTDTLSGYIRFGVDPLLSVVSAYPNYDVFQGDSMTWNFTDFAPMVTNIYNATFSVPAPPIVEINDELSFSAVINPVQGDMAPEDNYAELRHTVSGSYDPNDKWVSQDTISPDEITNAEFLSYRIRFQNTGTDTAFTVYVRDTLHGNLDWGSLQMVNASHDYTLSTREGKNLEWTFENILLPDSNTNEPLSHGYIYYRIKPKNTLVLGDEITNTAAIYFDYNPPVITNTTYSIVAVPTSIAENELNGSLEIFPNPSAGNFTLVFEHAGKDNFIFEMTDLSGRLLSRQNVQHEDKTVVRPGLDLARGTYLIRIANEESEVVRKVIIK